MKTFILKALIIDSAATEQRFFKNVAECFALLIDESPSSRANRREVPALHPHTQRGAGAALTNSSLSPLLLHVFPPRGFSSTQPESCHRLLRRRRVNVGVMDTLRPVTTQKEHPSRVEMGARGALCASCPRNSLCGTTVWFYPLFVEMWRHFQEAHHSHIYQIR